MLHLFRIGCDMLVKVRNVHKSFETEEGPLQVLRGVDMDINAGDHWALTGESGSGKSTLLYLIGALDSVDAGEIIVDGNNLATLDDKGRAEIRRQCVGIVFQQFNLIPSFNVRDNLSFYARLAQREDQKWVDEIAERLGLVPFLKRYPEQLSGGQQQRVAIGRVLAARPKLILADEPTGNLDEETSKSVMKLMLDLVRETGAALLMVTHSSSLADQMGRKAHLTAGRISS